jgi:hypothetical protein
MGSNIQHLDCCWPIENSTFLLLLPTGQLVQLADVYVHSHCLLISLISVSLSRFPVNLIVFPSFNCFSAKFRLCFRKKCKLFAKKRAETHNFRKTVALFFWNPICAKLLFFFWIFERFLSYSIPNMQIFVRGKCICKYILNWLTYWLTDLRTIWR